MQTIFAITYQNLKQITKIFTVAFFALLRLVAYNAAKNSVLTYTNRKHMNYKYSVTFILNAKAT